MIVTIDWKTPATILPAFINKVAKNMSLIKGRGIESQKLHKTQQLCLLCYSDHYIPCFLIAQPYIDLR